MKAASVCKKCDWPDGIATPIIDSNGITVGVRIVCQWCDHEELILHG